MAVTRRQFVRAGTAVAVTAGFSLSGLVADASHQKGEVIYPVPAKTLDDPRFRHNLGVFMDQLSTAFVLSTESGQTSKLMLVRVQDLATPEEKKIAASWEERFSLLFYGPANSPLQQGTHEAEHIELGTFPLFIVPVSSRSARRAAYEATFNRFVPQA